MGLIQRKKKPQNVVSIIILSSPRAQKNLLPGGCFTKECVLYYSTHFKI